MVPISRKRRIFNHPKKSHTVQRDKAAESSRTVVLSDVAMKNGKSVKGTRSGSRQRRALSHLKKLWLVYGG